RRQREAPAPRRIRRRRQAAGRLRHRRRPDDAIKTSLHPKGGSPKPPDIRFIRFQRAASRPPVHVQSGGPSVPPFLFLEELSHAILSRWRRPDLAAVKDSACASACIPSLIVATTIRPARTAVRRAVADGSARFYGLGIASEARAPPGSRPYAYADGRRGE